MSQGLINNKDYLGLLMDIKERIRSSRLRAALKVNQELLALYWFIGEALASKQTEWGDKFITNLVRDLKVEFPDSKGFSKRNLENMRRWYLYYTENSAIAQQAVAQIQLTKELQIAQQAVAQTGQKTVDPTLQALLFNIPWGHHTQYHPNYNT